MSVWTTKSLDIDRDYIILQHPLRGVNYIINGIKFRDSYAVVEKNSKSHHMLKKVPVLNKAKEFPLTYITSLKFITRDSDIRTVFGQDVFRTYTTKYKEKVELERAELKLKKLQEQEAILEQRQKDIEEKLRLETMIKEAQEQGQIEVIEELKNQIPEINKCVFIAENGTLCKHDSLDFSPSHHCHIHLLEDPKLSEFGLNKPTFMSKDERSKFREKVRNTLEKAKKQGKF